jgi:hypothetical protein
VSNIIGVVLLLALTVAAGTILWTFRPYLPAASPSASFDIHSGGSNPVWGDPTDCQPKGHWTYPLTASETASWVADYNAQCAEPNVSGNFSLLNTSQIVVSAVSPSNLLLSEIQFTFICNGTILVQGSLAAMSWIPGASYAAAANAPDLGKCGTFNPEANAGAFGTLYNRLGLFVPINGPNETVLSAGDTFILYIHNGGYPLDYACVTSEVDYGLCGGTVTGSPVLDSDDYHGAPPWCFTSPGRCIIYLTYTGNPSTLLATIPVYAMAPPTGA